MKTTTQHPDPTPRLAIIGFGPRGLGALEALLAQWGADPLHIDVFDPTPDPAAGPNFALDEPDLCLLNIPLRAINLPAPQGAAFPSAQDSLAAQGYEADTFPPRAALGAYLTERLAHLTRGLPSGITLKVHPFKAEALTPTSDATGRWTLTTVHGERFAPYDDILLSLGQPATTPDDQRQTWLHHAAKTGATVMPAYPARALLTAAEGWRGKAIGIRGLALSAFDVIRLLTMGLGGRFTDGDYIASGREPARILPFSLDGKPPAPKPATDEIDARFDPPETATSAFHNALETADMGTPDKALDALTAPLLDATEHVLHRLGATADRDALQSWIATERDTPGAQNTDTPSAFLNRAIAMAEGTEPPSIGYALGQIWRKWQDGLRTGFIARDLPAETAAALIAFDDGLKRYSYGPPIRAAHELRSLIRCGLVDLRAVNDPDISLTSDGWSLEEGNDRLHADIMIDAVLPSPDLEQIADPLIRGLCDAGHLVRAAPGLAAATGADALALSAAGTPQEGLGVVGRMALGRVIAVDSIHDCFGPATRRWAAAVAQRLRTKTRKS